MTVAVSFGLDLNNLCSNPLKTLIVAETLQMRSAGSRQVSVLKGSTEKNRDV